MNTGQQCAGGASIQLGDELDLGRKDSLGDGQGDSARMTPADVIYRVATVTAVLYLLVSVL
jgi:hypothetical protein